MILRRRTYKRVLNDKYGYFMRNVTYFSSGTLHGADDIEQNIYTRCNLREVPVGYFNKAYRNASSEKIYYGTNSIAQAAIGWVVSATTIVVSTARSIYKSTNGGASWSKICSLTFPYLYADCLFSPTIYSDGSYIWVAYVSRDTPTPSDQIIGGSCYKTLSIFRCNMDGTNSIRTDLYTASLISDSYFDCYRGAFFLSNVSPRGLILILLNNTKSYKLYAILDLKRTLISDSVYIQSSNDGRYEGAGLWLHDGTTYGKFYIDIFDRDVWHKKYYTISAYDFSSYGSITATDITTTINNNISDLVEDAHDKYSITLCVASSKVASNKYFIIASQDGRGTFLSCSKNFTDVVVLAHYNDLNIDTGLSVTTWPCGAFVTPDERWGISISNYANIVFDLRGNRFFSTELFGSFDTGPRTTTMDNFESFMVPNSNVYV